MSRQQLYDQFKDQVVGSVVERNDEKEEQQLQQQEDVARAPIPTHRSQQQPDLFTRHNDGELRLPCGCTPLRHALKNGSSVEVVEL